MSVLINASTSTGLVQSADTSGEIELQSNGTTALKVNTNEGIQILNCLGVGNATPSTSGAGITFPSTQSASSDANTLDDYEEGTWTPVMTAGTGSITTQSSAGRYTKIGNMVIMTGRITVSNWGTGGGTPTINLPFTNADQFNAIGDETAVNGKVVAGRQSTTGSSSFDFVYFDNSSPANTGGAGANFIFSATYRTTQ